MLTIIWPNRASADDILHALDDPEPNPEQAAPEAPMSVRRLAWEHIQRVLAEHDGNISATARAQYAPQVSPADVGENRLALDFRAMT